MAPSGPVADPGREQSVRFGLRSPRKREVEYHSFRIGNPNLHAGDFYRAWGTIEGS